MKKGVWLVLLLISAATAVSARTYSVATDGNDENRGSEAEPLRSIQKAAGAARAGDVIVVRGGVYREPVVLRFSGRRGRPIVLKNYPGEQPVIQPGERGEQPPGHGVLLQAQQGYQKPIGWITIEGLEIRYGHDGIKIYNAHDSVIRNCHIHENWNQGILGNGNRVLIDRNIIAGNGTNKQTAQNLIHGIYATGSAFTITNNLIHSNTAYGIQVAAYDYKEESMAGPEYADAKNWLIANNTIAFNRNRAGIVVWQDGVENCVIQNNIFYKNGGVNGILFYSQQDRRHPVRNNIFYPPGENLVATEANAYEAIDNRQIDPCFVDAASFNFHLRAGSPAIDTEFVDRAPATDFEGKRRPQGYKVDIGAHEFSFAAGPLRTHPANSRYFTDGTRSADGSLKVVYLTGSHTWNNLVDMDKADPPAPFAFEAYLDFLERYGHNFIRLWTWDSVAWDTRANRRLGKDFVHHCAPLAWARTGPGNALDGKPKFDLTKFNPEYFDRLRSRVRAASERGIYVSVMLFEGWGLRHGDRNRAPAPNGWAYRSHPFCPDNNINGIAGDLNGDGIVLEVHSLASPAISALQEAYIRKVVDTVSDLDNVLFEVANEGGDKQWNWWVVKTVKGYEGTKPKQHPVGITGHGGERVATMLASPADWISPGGQDGYRDPAPAWDGRKVSLLDTDHIWGVGGNHGWVWRSFLRGHNPIFMDPYDGSVLGNRFDPKFEPLRRNMGYARQYARKMNLAAMAPHGELASTQFCLADPGREYLVYLPDGGEVTVDLSAASGAIAVEWLDPGSGQTTPGASASGGKKSSFRPPFEGDAVLYLRRQP